MPTPSPLTDKMLAFAAVPNFRYDEAVDWAVDLLLRCYDTPNLSYFGRLVEAYQPGESPRVP